MHEPVMLEAVTEPLQVILEAVTEPLEVKEPLETVSAEIPPTTVNPVHPAFPPVDTVRADVLEAPAESPMVVPLPVVWVANVPVVSKNA